MNYKIFLLIGFIILISIPSVFATVDSPYTDKIEILESSCENNSSNISLNPDIYITPENYDNYIDNEGNLNSLINSGDTIIFSGEFTDKKAIKLSKELIIKGENAKFTNTCIYICSSNCFISNLTIINNDSDLFGFFIKDSSNITLLNNYIEIYDKIRSYGIFVLNSSSSTILNNRIINYGEDLTYSIIGYGCNNSKILNNTIKTVGTSIIHSYENEMNIYKDYSIKECYKTYGIILTYSSGNYIFNNNINLSSLISEVEIPESTNTLIGLDLYFGCHNNLVDNNIINIEGKDPYIYGIGVIGASFDNSKTTSENNSFVNNFVNITGEYYVCGLIAGNKAINTLFDNNTVILKSNNITYGVTLELSQNSTVTNNYINQNADGNYVMELYDSDNNFIDNNRIIVDYSKKTNIFSLYASDNNIITNNPFNIKSSNGNLINTKEDHSDSINIENTAFSLFNSDNNKISNNNGNFTNAEESIIKYSKNNLLENNNINSNTQESSSSVNEKSSSATYEKGDSGVGDLIDGTSNSKGSNAYYMDEILSEPTSETYNIVALICVFVVIIFCYGFLRKSNDDEDE